MKRIGFVILLFVLVCSCIEKNNKNEISTWTLHYYLDDFNEITDKKYISAWCNGTFNNSLTNGDIDVKIIINNSYFCLDMYEYGNRFVSHRDNDIFFKIKGEDGTIISEDYSSLIFVFNSQIQSDNEKTDSIFNIFLAGGNIKFYVKTINKYSKLTTYYHFELPNSIGLANLLDSIR